VPALDRLIDAAEYLIKWLEDKYWKDERPALNGKLEKWVERETEADDDDAIKEVDPREELLDKYTSLMSKKLDTPTDDKLAKDFEDLIEGLTMSASQNIDEFVDLLLKPGYFLPNQRQGEKSQNSYHLNFRTSFLA
jgi:hypothetical protein